jgi:hypothetical protein
MPNPKASPCNGLFSPSKTNPDVCKWWVIISNNTNLSWRPVCRNKQRMDIQCPTDGNDPTLQQADIEAKQWDQPIVRPTPIKIK